MPYPTSLRYAPSVYLAEGADANGLFFYLNLHYCSPKTRGDKDDT